MEINTDKSGSESGDERPSWRWNRPPCPRCGSRRFIPIVYGEYPTELQADVVRTARKGLAVMVRREPKVGDPQFACGKCKLPLDQGPKW